MRGSDVSSTVDAMRRFSNLIGWLSFLMLCGGIACIWIERPVPAVILLVLAGVSIGTIVPHSDSDSGSTHGASDST